jgi:hypothetical protein
MEKEYELKDSGTRREFDTGARRDMGEGKGDPSLIPTYPLRRLSMWYEKGAKKYGKHNWVLGIPLSSYISSVNRHIWSLQEGLEDEDHAAAAIWNLFSFIMTKKYIEDGELPKELNDLVHSVEDAKRVRESIANENR